MKIAFTSCIHLAQFPEQTIWSDIAAQRPDYLFLLGDQIYMDFWPYLGAPAGWSDKEFEQEMRLRYAAQWREPHFKRLLEQLRPRQGVDGGLYGTWDDHDFAWNSANGREVPVSKKRTAARLFSEYMGSPAGEHGIFHAVPLRSAGRTVGKAIFLDTRWNRDAPGTDRDLLGEPQFEFLRQELAVLAPDALTIVCAGTPQRATAKGWALYRRDWLRFQQLLGDRRALFLTGDIHETAFLPPASGSRLYEIVASGAAVRKFAAAGKRRNWGLLDWSPERTRVMLADKRGAQRYTIFNDSFRYEEHEPDEA